ncbi:hypothetical protein CEN49_19970 [Fischerella thermalis CCMEE 5273]|nr:hypothetical protein CEN49_19970 [Fischerella thermalis CCMEE 5273]
MDHQLVSLYNSIQSGYNVVTDNRYEQLVQKEKDRYIPIHSWYQFKESYSPMLLGQLLNELKIGGSLRLLDPFCGSGTTLLSGILDTNLSLNCVTGIEVNPFIHFMAKTKLRFHELNLDKAEKFITYLCSCDLSLNIHDFAVPELTTIKRAYANETLAQLLHLKQLIKYYFSSDTYEHDFFMLAFASILEPVSCMIKTGRALKVNRKKEPHNVKEIYLHKVYRMVDDIISIGKEVNLKAMNINVICQDVRNYIELVHSGYNFVIFSPPYLNHFDYTEVYKIELWMLDFVTSYEEFKSLRFKTFRSHPSVKFNKTNYYKSYNSSFIHEMMNILDSSNREERFYPTFRGYIDDMYKTLDHLNEITSGNATVCCVIANSLFGSEKYNNLTPVATDLLISEIANDIGFEVLEIKKARDVTRRGIRFPFGRESIIVMRKRIPEQQSSDAGEDKDVLLNIAL